MFLFPRKENSFLPSHKTPSQSIRFHTTSGKTGRPSVRTMYEIYRHLTPPFLISLLAYNTKEKMVPEFLDNLPEGSKKALHVFYILQ